MKEARRAARIDTAHHDTQRATHHDKSGPLQGAAAAERNDKMFVSENLSVNEKNHLVIGKNDTVELAKEYGTPLYVLDEDLIRKNCRIYKDAIDKYYNENGLVLYGNKAFCSVYTCKLAAEEGRGADVVS